RAGGRAGGAGRVHLRPLRLPGQGGAVHAVHGGPDVPVRGRDPAHLRDAVHAQPAGQPDGGDPGAGRVRPATDDHHPAPVLPERPRRDRGGGHDRRLLTVRLLLADPAADGPPGDRHRVGAGDRGKLEQLHAPAGRLQRRAELDPPARRTAVPGPVQLRHRADPRLPRAGHAARTGVLRSCGTPPDRWPHSGSDERVTMLHVSGAELRTSDDRPVRLRGVGLGGWMNMENFITGYPANEASMRAAVRQVLGEERAELFFDRLLSSFFTEQDAALLARLGMNCVRIPVNYRHFESDDRPFEITEYGFGHLDRVIGLLGSHGIYSVIDLHALPGSQNQHWHSDNPTHVASFWQHRHFQDRVVHLWEAIADHYRDNPWVAGYNPINEPGDPSGKVVGPFYDRLVKAVRAADPRHVLFLDGNTYSTDFSIFREVYENTVFVCHDYALAGFAHGGGYPGYTQGRWCDRDELERTFEERSRFQRETGTPLWVGEFGPVYTGDPELDRERYQILRDQLEIYDGHQAGWSLWTYKDV